MANSKWAVSVVAADGGYQMGGIRIMITITIRTDKVTLGSLSAEGWGPRGVHKR